MNSPQHQSSHQHYTQYPAQYPQQYGQQYQNPPYPPQHYYVQQHPPVPQVKKGISKWVWISIAAGTLMLLVFAAMVDDPIPDEKKESTKVAGPAESEPTASEPVTTPMNPLQSKTDTKAKRRQIAAELRTLARQGRSMQRLRNTSSPAQLRRCGALMRDRQSKARALRAEAQKLGYHSLTEASIHAFMCVSCSRMALSSCKEVVAVLRGVRRRRR